MMEGLEYPIDYSLESMAIDNEDELKLPKIKSIQELEIELPEVRCMKGDCDRDYSPG